MLVNLGKLPFIHKNKIKARQNVRGIEDKTVNEIKKHTGIVRKCMTRYHYVCLAVLTTFPDSTFCWEIIMSIVEHLLWARSCSSIKNITLKKILFKSLH